MLSHWDVAFFECLLRVLERVTKDRNNKPRHALLSPIYFCLITPVFYASDAVVEYILATKSHPVDRRADPLSCFLDADMAVLGKRPEAYDGCAALIREEYRHVPHDVYCEKRADILADFIGGVGGGGAVGAGEEEERTITKTTFKTAAMQESLEARAVENLRREIDSLRRGVIPSLASAV